MDQPVPFDTRVGQDFNHDFHLALINVAHLRGNKLSIIGRVYCFTFEKIKVCRSCSRTQRVFEGEYRLWRGQAQALFQNWSFDQLRT